MLNHGPAPMGWWLDLSEAQQFSARWRNLQEQPVLATPHLRLKALLASENDSSLHWAVCLLASDELIGYFCLQDIDLDHSQAELRFWIEPKPGWELRAVEAGQAVLAYAFGQLSLVSLHAFSICGQRSSYNALVRMGLRPLDGHSKARESWDRCPEVQVWNVTRHRWLRDLKA